MTTALDTHTPDDTVVRRTVRASMPLDLFENDQEYLLLADLPGVRAEDLNVTLEGRDLLVEARRPDAEHGTAELNGWPIFDYRRTLRVPDGVTADGVSAELDNGVLRLHIAKPAVVAPKRIPVSIA